jgi:hypothetical protein
MREGQRFILRASVYVLAFAWMILFSTSVLAQVDEFGKVDTCRIVVVQDQKNGQAVAHVYVFNDEDLAALTLPFRYGDNTSPVKCDSVVFRNTRSEALGMKTELRDSTDQTVLIGIVDFTGNVPLVKGYGEVARIYFSFPANERFQDFVMDTTWIRPFNMLKFVTPDPQGIYPAFDNSQALIRGGIPIRAPEKATEEEKAKTPPPDTTGEKK